MWGKSTAIAPTWTAAKANRQHLHSANHKKGTGPTVLLTLPLSGTAVLGASGADPSRKHVLEIVTQIQRADYEGNRTALKRLYGELAPFVQSKGLGPGYDIGVVLRCGGGFSMGLTTLLTRKSKRRI
jgi:hypothetical protein